MKIILSTPSDQCSGFICAPSFTASSIIEISNDWAVPGKGWNMYSIFLLKIHLYSRKTFFKYTKIKRSLVHESVPWHRVWIFWNISPPKWIQMEENVARVIPTLRLQSIRSSHSVCCQMQDRQCLLAKTFSEENWVKQWPQTLEGLDD